MHKVKLYRDNMDKIIFRNIFPRDYEKYLGLLSQLTKTGDISKKMFEKRLSEVNKNPNLHLFVMEDDETKDLVASGTLYVEPKFIHSCSKMGHIEDIVVNKKYRGKRYGYHIIRFLVEIAKKEKCYKVSLVCKNKNIPFYEKCGFTQSEFEMNCRL